MRKWSQGRELKYEQDEEGNNFKRTILQRERENETVSRDACAKVT